MDNETIFETARLLIDELAESFETPEPNRLDAHLHRREDLIVAVAGLRVKRLGYLACITGLDPGADVDYLEVLYHFCPDAALINLRLKVPKADATLPSLSGIIPSAESFERELSEMFGITITGLRNPERLYLPEDWQDGVFPLRKDFDPLKIAHRN